MAVVLLALAQAFLPGVARNRLRDELAERGKVERVEVHAFPAIKLMWQSADRIEIGMRDYRARRTDDIAEQLATLDGVGRFDSRIAVVDAQRVRLTDVSLRKRGEEVVGRATLSRADLERALPGSLSVRPVSSGGTELVLRATTGAASVDFTLSASNGRLVVRPEIPLGGVLALTVFSDARVQVESISARPQGDGWGITARARVP